MITVDKYRSACSLNERFCYHYQNDRMDVIIDSAVDIDNFESKDETPLTIFVFDKYCFKQAAMYLNGISKSSFIIEHRPIMRALNYSELNKSCSNVLGLVKELNKIASINGDLDRMNEGYFTTIGEIVLHT